jgi:hypothetical protein
MAQHAACKLVAAGVAAQQIAIHRGVLAGPALHVEFVQPETALIFAAQNNCPWLVFPQAAAGAGPSLPGTCFTSLLSPPSCKCGAASGVLLRLHV